MREQRRLAAVLAADVVGYSRLMGRNEAGTLVRLKEHRAQCLEPALARNGGRLVKLAGDGALAEFGSAVDALRAAIEFQQAVDRANADQPQDQQIVFRIGLHLGDLLVDGDDLYGDGVNIATRLEAEAPAGGIVISRTVHEAVAGRVKATFDDLGSLALKNIERPVQAFSVKWQPEDWQTPVSSEATAAFAAGPTAPLPLPDRPSIAVLPFYNMSGDPEQEYFSDGITEDIITELSRFHSLFVIARNSSFSYRGRSPDIRQIGRELGVRYVLEGSIRKSSNRVRVTGQLIDTLTGNHIWAERYDRVLDDIFAVQEEVTQAIVTVIAPQIEATEQSKASRRRPGNLTAYELSLRAWTHALQGIGKADRTLIDQSIREANEALAIDPNCVPALNVLASAYGNALHLQMATDRKHALREATAAAARAIELDDGNSLGYALKALCIFHDGQVDRYSDALADARRAYELNPNDTIVRQVLAQLETAAGEPKRAIEHLNQVLRLNPRQPRRHVTYNMLAHASFGAEQYIEGANWASRAINESPEYPPPHLLLAICLVGMGEIDKAKAAFSAGQKLSPEFFGTRLKGTPAYARPEDRKRATTFLRIAAGLADPSAAEAQR
jgi:adenylate cyclase